MTLGNLDLFSVQSRSKRDRLAQLLQAKTATVAEVYPLTHGQEALWFLAQLSPNNFAYNLPFVFPIESNVRVDLLEQALNLIIRRHPSLRVRFEGYPVRQVITPLLELTILEEDFGERSSEQLRARIRELNRAPFQLANGPLLRATVFRRGSEPDLLLLSVHHIVFDGVSAKIVIEQLLGAYSELKKNRKIPATYPISRYSEFVTWQKQLLEGSEGKELQNYWRTELEGEIPILDLPTDYSRPAVQTYNGESLKFDIDGPCLQKLRAFAEDQNATLYMVLLGAFFTLLHRYSGQRDIVVGTPMMGRTEPGFECVVGYFINVLPIRARLTEEPVFSELLQQVREKVYGAIQHQDYPFPLLVQQQKIARDPSRSPIFQVAFTLENWVKNHETLDGSERLTQSPSLEPFEWLHQEGEFDLTLDIFDLGETLRAAFRFNPDLFSIETISRMTGHFRRILDHIIGDSKISLWEIPLIGPEETERLLHAWNQTQRKFPEDKCIHDLLVEQASRTPERIAVTCGSESLTYVELDLQSNRFASLLRERGAGRNTRVGICLDRGIKMLISVLGILKSGAAYVPLDPAFPAERLSFMAGDAKLHLILTQRKHTSLFALQPIQCLDIESLDQIDTAEVQGQSSSPSDDAYLIYTSGSTGNPKGVEITHRSVVNFLQSMAEAPGISPDDILLAVTTLSFDIAGLELFLPLTIGAQVVIASQSDSVDPGRQLALMKNSRATIMQATPATWRMLLESGWRDPLPLKILCGGEALSRPLANRLLELGREVWNLFGPTETTIWSAVAQLRQTEEPVSLGRPIANTQLYILDRHKQLAPIGVPGELYIGGEGVGRGYWNRPDLTVEKFVSNSFNPTVSQRLYRTGDLARFQNDGTLLFLGRLDHQVKLRGFRIELGEIENNLQKHPSVRQAVVIATGDQLVAYIILNDISGMTPGDLRAFLRSSLPEYMLPSVFVKMERFPLTPNGKVDRKQLPTPDQGRMESSEFVPARGIVEKELGRIWSEALHLEKVSAHENFFELGGHSLLATQVVRRVRQLYEIELLDLFTYPTISSLAGFIESRQMPPPAAEINKLVSDVSFRNKQFSDGIAIIGMAGRFPGASNIDEFWNNLKGGVESISFFETEEVLATGIEPELLKRPNYVKAGGVLAGADMFDPVFFGYSQAQARLLDPQQRVLLECAWQALEDAGCDPKRYAGRIGVFSGVAANTYWHPDLRTLSENSSAALASLAFTSNDRDFASTRISYKLGLTGPSLAVQTACSSSLVAVHLACQSLLNGDCDAALAGGVSIMFPQNAGYLHQKDMVLSPDGHCRAFDEKGEGTIFSNGVGLVLLKPLAKALADRDQIYAVIRGSAVNNDGTSKVDFMAPSVQGQSGAISLALNRAGVDPKTIGYVEAHGTGTVVGDPIEVRALVEAFKNEKIEQGSCALGSVKTNVGHLNTAAGVAGLIKAVLCLRDKVLVPSLHFQSPNPHLSLDRTPFYINTRFTPWQESGHPRRAGISSFGIGGTNAHAILEEPPGFDKKANLRSIRMLPISAKSSSALALMAQNLAAHLRQNPGISLADLSFTLQTGRQSFEWRRFLVCENTAAAIEALEAASEARQAEPETSVTFVFADYSRPAPVLELYQKEPRFRRCIDEGCAVLRTHFGTDPLTLLFPGEDSYSEVMEQWTSPAISIPLSVLLNHSLAMLWEGWGIQPTHSVGSAFSKYAAATVAGVFKISDVLPILFQLGRELSINNDSTQPSDLWRGLPLQVPKMPLIDARTGRQLSDSDAIDYKYWARLETPGFAEGALTSGARFLIELGPVGSAKPLLSGINTVRILPSLAKPGEAGSNSAQILHSLGILWQAGHQVEWQALFDGEQPQKISLPGHPFDRQRYWLDNPTAKSVPSRSVNSSPQPWAIAVSNEVCRMHFSGDEFYFRDHVVEGEKILPGAVLLELARAVAQARSGNRLVTRLKQIFFRRPIIANGRRHDIEVAFEPGGATDEFKIFSSQDDSRILHAQGKAGTEPVHMGDSLDFKAIRERCTLKCAGSDLYSLMRKYGMDYGPGLTAISQVDYNERELLAYLRVPDASWLAPAAFGLHPALIDGAFQTIALLVKEEAEAANTPYLPFSLGELQIQQALPRDCWIYVRRNESLPSSAKAVRTFDISINDNAGVAVAHFRDYSIKFFPPSKIPKARNPSQAAPALLYEPVWEKTLLEPTALINARDVLLVGNEALASAFETVLRQRFGPECRTTRWMPHQEQSIKPDHIVFFSENAQEQFEISASRDLKLLFEIGKRFLVKKEAPIHFLFCGVGERSMPLVTAVAAFGRSLLHETGGIDFRSVRLDPTADASFIGNAILREWSQPTSGAKIQELEYRGDERFQRKFKRVFSEDPGREELAFKVGGTYLITGGLGGVGRLLCEYLSEQFRARLILIGRRPLDEPARAFLANKEALYFEADINDEISLVKILNVARMRFGAFHGILHCAGILDDGFLASKTAESFARVLRPKVDGTLVLDRLTASEPLDFFAMFSSVSSVIGTPGQCDYGAANGFMDGFAELRESWREAGQRSGVTISFNWGLWQDGGMRVSKDMEENIRRTTGIAPLSTKTALSALRFGIGAKRQRLIALQGNSTKIESLFSNIRPAAAQPSAAVAPRILSTLRDRVATLLGVQPETVNVEKDMGEFGLDSVLVIDLITGLNTLYSLDLSPSIFFEQKTLGDLAGFIASQKPALEGLDRSKNGMEEAGGKHGSFAETTAAVGDRRLNGSSEISFRATESDPEVERVSSGAPSSNSHSRASEPIAIVGMAGVFPKSPDLETFWTNLVSSKDLISEVPADRWDWREYFGDPRKEPRKMNIKWGAFLTEIDKFDARFFNLPPREAELMDPQHRLMLQTVWKALDDAGHPARSLSGSSTGVFIGICSADYQELMLRTVSDVDIRAGSGTAMDIIPSRISFLLNLHGPSEISATACSSSLVAVHRAVQAIRHGECDQAIVGGVNLMITPTLYLCYGKAGMLAQDGQCKTFDHRANGYVRGEGAAAVLIKPLRRALADGDHIYGVIKGTAVNHAGHTRTFGAPSPQAEAEVIRKAITDADISPATINYIEAHGTGTPLGDPIEISGLEKAFREVSDGRGESLPAGFCAIASVKTNVGHMEAAAGIAGLVKVLLSMQHKKLPASRNFEKLNPYIKLEGTPFYVLDRTVAWEQIRDENNRPLPRRAGISSFGFGGVNAHVVLEEFVETREGSSRSPKPELVVLSARSNAALREYAQLMADWFQKEFAGVRNGHPEPAFAAIAYTLQVGRDQMPERLAVVAESPLKAAAQLRAWLQGEESQTVFYNKTSARRQPSDLEISLTIEEFQSLHERNELAQIAALWISGPDIPWGPIRSHDGHIRLSMPTCPFARERYWLAPEIATPAETVAPLNAVDTILDHLRNSRITADEAATLLEALSENEIKT